MSKVMLINPPQKYYNKSMKFGVYIPIGLLNIGAMIKDSCNLKIFDCLVTDFQKKKTKNYISYGTPIEKIKKTIKNFNPDIIGISVPFSAQLENAIRISKICKTINSNIKIVFGGPEASVRYRYLLENNYCDFCVVGEGEKSFYEFVKKINIGSSLKDVGGLAYRINNKIHYKPKKFLEKLDELHFPAYELINFKDYFKNPYIYKNRSFINKNSISIITSRGCPYNCIFCSIHLHMGYKYRFHSPDYVINHLKYCIQKYGITKFHFEDDNLSLDKSRFEKILDKIIKNKLNIEWDIPNGLQADTLDSNLLKKMKESGCKSISVGIESGNQEVLNNIIKKFSSLDNILRVVRYCKKLKINLIGFYVIGFPGETKKNIKETINLALKLLRKFDVTPGIFFATPLYGTELYNICVRNNLIPKNLTDYDFSTATQSYGNPMITTKDFSKDELRDIIRDYSFKLKIEFIRYHIRLCSYKFKEIFNKLTHSKNLNKKVKKMNVRKILRTIFRFTVKTFSWTKIGRLIPLKVYQLLTSHLRDPNSIVTTHGHKMFLDSKDGLYLSVNENRDPLAIKLVQREVKKGDTVLDLGAHIGYYTLIFAKLVGEKGKVFAFEPEPDNFKILKKNIEANGYKNVILIRKAVSNKTEKAKLYLCDDDSQYHRIYDLHDGRKSIDIEVISLNDYFKNYNKIDFIKIDIEGSEKEAVQGMTKLLQRNKDVKIMTEFFPSYLKDAGTEPQEFLRLLLELGFKLYNINEKKGEIEYTSISRLLRTYLVNKQKYTNLFCKKDTCIKEQFNRLE